MKSIRRSSYLVFSSSLHSSLATRHWELRWAAVLVIVYAQETTLVGKMLGVRPLVAIGSVSYSLYLIHENNLRFCQVVAGRLVPSSWPMFNGIVQVALHLSIATVFWYCCERPFLNSRVGVARQEFPGAIQVSRLT